MNKTDQKPLLTKKFIHNANLEQASPPTTPALVGIIDKQNYKIFEVYVIVI